METVRFRVHAARNSPTFDGTQSISNKAVVTDF
jgi:hypothetical protein